MVPLNDFFESYGSVHEIEKIMESVCIITINKKRDANMDLIIFAAFQAVCSMVRFQNFFN